jgi:GAF domain-containing protein
MLEKAVRICDAKFGNIYRWDNEALHLMASYNTPAAFAATRGRSPNRPSLQTPAGRMIATKTLVHVPDLAAYPAYAERDPWTVSGVELAGVRTLLVVPMLKEDELVGGFTIYRQEVRPFSDKQIELAKNFAAQAVIAIENARLLNELRQRTTDLTEALEQQRATSDLLQVISGSPGNLEPVYQAMLENAVGILGANFGNMFLYEDDAFRTVAMYNAPEAYANAPHARAVSSATR